MVVDAEVEAAIHEVTPLAPLHNAPALAALEATREALPDVPHVAVFDTAFHATLPREAPRTPSPTVGERSGACAATAFTASPCNGPANRSR